MKVYLHIASSQTKKANWETTFSGQLEMEGVPNIGQYIQIEETVAKKLQHAILRKCTTAALYHNWLYKEEDDDTIYLRINEYSDLKIEQVKWIPNSEKVYECHVLVYPVMDYGEIDVKLKDITEEALAETKALYI